MVKRDELAGDLAPLDPGADDARPRADQRSGYAVEASQTPKGDLLTIDAADDQAYFGDRPDPCRPDRSSCGPRHSEEEVHDCLGPIGAADARRRRAQPTLASCHDAPRIVGRFSVHRLAAQTCLAYIEPMVQGSHKVRRSRDIHLPRSVKLGGAAGLLVWGCSVSEKDYTAQAPDGQDASGDAGADAGGRGGADARGGAGGGGADGGGAVAAGGTAGPIGEGSAGEPGEGGAGVPGEATCSEADCQNGSTCAASGEQCECLAGYEGALCEINVDDCAPSPCLNRGTCVDGVDAFTCSCPASYSGARCEREVQDCADQPCLNGAVCESTVDGYLCECKAGYEGRNCETNIDDCASNPCANGGACKDGLAAHTCSCKPGFSGANCQTNINDCALHECVNGATCVDGVLEYTCRCAAGFFGAKCELLRFERLSPMPPSPTVNAVSADGKVIVGGGADNPRGDVKPFRWSHADGLQYLVSLSESLIWGQAFDVNADGNVITGEAGFDALRGAFRWTASTGMVVLPHIPGATEAVGRAINGVGNVIVGDSSGRLFRWTSTTQTTDLGVFGGNASNQAGAVSADGTVLVGWGFGNPTGADGALRWTSSNVTWMLPPDATNETNSAATDVSADGVVAVGWYSQGATSGAFRWSFQTGFQVIPSRPGLTIGRAQATNADGSVIVGDGTTLSGSLGTVWIWDAANGTRLLSDVLKGFGVDMSAWDDMDVADVSADGRVLVGNGTLADTLARGVWMARLYP